MRWVSRSIVVALLCAPLSACSPLDALKLVSSGTNVAANTQIGKTNTQSVGGTSVTEQSIVRPKARDIRQSADTNRVRADQVQTVVVNEMPVWLIIALVIAVFLDSPLRWPGQIASFFKTKVIEVAESGPGKS